MSLGVRTCLGVLISTSDSSSESEDEFAISAVVKIIQERVPRPRRMEEFMSVISFYSGKLKILGMLAVSFFNYF